MLKRCFDLALTLAALPVVAPVLIGIAAAIKLTSPGPVFYRGARVGRRGQIFRIFKFRTMVLNADKIGGSSTPDDDPRITAVGKILRRYKLDELPQLLNVLSGEMSFVGPRPQVQSEVAMYTPAERVLLEAKPGITDYASLVFRDEGAILRGSADPDKAYREKIAPLKIHLGLYYVRHRTLIEDLKLIAATAGAILGIDPAWCVSPALKKSGASRLKLAS
ncbi:MAG: sugar transferase [Acidobacteriota bacterium]|nr:sugar transferase [Acidobacteriota bacterium]